VSLCWVWLVEEIKIALLTHISNIVSRTTDDNKYSATQGAHLNLNEVCRKRLVFWSIKFQLLLTHWLQRPGHGNKNMAYGIDLWRRSSSCNAGWIQNSKAREGRREVTMTVFSVCKPAASCDWFRSHYLTTSPFIKNRKKMNDHSWLLNRKNCLGQSRALPCPWGRWLALGPMVAVMQPMARQFLGCRPSRAVAAGPWARMGGGMLADQWPPWTTLPSPRRMCLAGVDILLKSICIMNLRWAHWRRCSIRAFTSYQQRSMKRQWGGFWVIDLCQNNFHAPMVHWFTRTYAMLAPMSQDKDYQVEQV